MSLLARLCTAGAVTFCASALAQEPETDPYLYAERPEPTNAWQYTPLPPKEDLPAEIATRLARDALFDKHFGAPKPLDQPQPFGFGVAMCSGPRPSIPIGPDISIVVARFARFHPVLSYSRRTIYTELYLDVEQVFTANHPRVAPGAVLTVLEPGGAVQMPNGVILKQHLNPRWYGLIPQHRYVLFLKHRQHGDYYNVTKSWELLDGKAVPNSGEDIRRAREGKSPYAGLSEPDFIAAVTALATAPDPLSH